MNFFWFVKRELAGKSYKIKIHAIISFYFSFHVKYRLPSRAQYELLNLTVEINCCGKYVARETQPNRSAPQLNLTSVASAPKRETVLDIKIEGEFFPFREDTNWGFEFG